MRTVATGTALAVLAAAALLSQAPDRPGHIEPPTARTRPATTSAGPKLPPPPPPLLARGRDVPTHPHVLSWAVVDVATAATIAQAPCVGCTNHAASTIKVWIAGDALRRAGPRPPADVLRDVDAALVDSDNAAATRLFAGRDNLWQMTRTCAMMRTLPSTSWGATELTAGDLALLGACAARGNIAGGTWTTHLLDRMRAVRGPGRFGPVDALPAADIALKNGWLFVAGEWHVNCLAIVNGTWSIGILTRYPAALGLDHGAHLCAAVTRALATPHPASSPGTDRTTQEKM